MRPAYISIAGINSFIEKQEINFESFYSDSFFCIYGATGSGKTTVLDCIILALYGNGDRVDTIPEYINLSSEKGEIVFRFYFGDELYEVNKTFTKKGTGKSLLYNLTTNTLLADRPENVSKAIVELLGGLTRAEFTQVVILEQGKFSKFLTAEKAKRSRIISQLFSLSKFEGLNKKFNSLKSKYDADIRELSARLEKYDDITEEKRAEFTSICDSLAVRQEKLKQEIETLEKRIILLTHDKANFEQLNFASANLQASKVLLKAKIDEIEIIKQKKLEIESVQAEILIAREKFLSIQNFLENSAILQREMVAAFELSDERKKLLEGYLNVDKARMNSENELVHFRAEANKIAAQKAKIDVLVQQKTDEGSLKELELKKQLEYLKQELEKAKECDMAAHLGSKLRTGEKCPVCFNVVNNTPLHDASKTSSLAKAVAKLSNELDSFSVIFKKELEALAVERSECEKSAELTAKSLEQTAVHMQKLTSECEGIKLRGQQLYSELSRFLSSAAVRIGLDEGTLDVSTKKIDETLEKLKGYLEKESKNASHKAMKLKEQIANGEQKIKGTIEQETQLSKELSVLEGKCRAYEADIVRLGKVNFEPKELESLIQKKKLCTDEYNQVITKLHLCQESIKRIDQNEKSKAELVKSLASVKKLYDNAHELSQLFLGNKFLEYIEQEYIHKFTLSASERLFSLSNGKYSLEYNDEDDKKSGFYVVDYLREGQRRKIRTLSGGETFLASISLAMAISEQIALDKQFDFFFLDEGFGTLDEQALDTVASALKTLSEQMLVGVVTHRPELIEKIPARIKITASTQDKGTTAEVELL